MSFSSRTSRLTALFSASALVLALAACDGDDTADPDTDEVSDSSEEPGSSDDSAASDDPESALKDAVTAMADWDGIALDVSFQADADARASILEDEPDDAELLDTVMNSSLSIIATGDDAQGAVQISVDVDGTTMFEMYVASDGDEVGEFALRVDLPSILDMVDDPSATAEFEALLGQAGMFGLQDAADALAEGGWVGIAGLDEAAAMMDGFGAVEDDAEVDEEQAEAAVQAFAERTERFIDEDVVVSHVGSDDVGERLRVVAPGPALESYLEDVVAILATNDLVDGLGADELQGELDELSAEDMTLDVWVSGGEVAQFAVDIAQLDEEAEIDGEFLLIIGLSNHTGSLSPPSTSATVDVMELFGSFMGGMGEMDLGGFDDEDLGDMDGGSEDVEMSQEEIEMMLSFMDCISEDELESFEFFMPELVGPAEQALADGTLEYC